jgi:hypothetical protein
VVRVSIASVAEFSERVWPAYLELSQAAPGGDLPLLEIALAPGEYRDANWSIGERDAAHDLHVVLRAAQTDQPPILQNVSLAVTARRIDITGLVVRRHGARNGVLRIAVGRTLTIERCAFVLNQVLNPSPGPLLELTSTAAGGVEAVLRQCWFVDNWLPGGGGVVGCTPEPPYFFERLRLEEVAFVGNHAAACVVPHTTAFLELVRCLVVLPVEQVDAEFVRRTSEGMRIANEDTPVTVSNALLTPLLEQWRIDAAEGRPSPIDHLRRSLMGQS